MKQFRLNNTQAIVTVDDEDFAFVTTLCMWSDDSKGYARSSKLFGGSHVLLHRVVAARMGLDVDGLHVHHIDENPLNNTRANLVMKTASQHTSDHNLTRVYPTGDNHGNTEWSDAEVLDVVSAVMYAGGTQRDMAAISGMSFAHIGDIVHGRKRGYLLPKIQTIIEKSNWREGNRSNTDSETLELVREYLSSGLSASAFATRSGKISRQHLMNIVNGIRLPHLQDEIRKMKG